MTILSEIVDYKEQLLKDGYYHDKLQNLKGVKHKNKSRLTDALIKNDNLTLIAEIKSKSPSVKAFQQTNIIKQVSDYERYGANAISVLTDERYFGGSFERLQQISETTQLPVLCKDFIIDHFKLMLHKSRCFNYFTHCKYSYRRKVTTTLSICKF